MWDKNIQSIDVCIGEAIDSQSRSICHAAVVMFGKCVSYYLSTSQGERTSNAVIKNVPLEMLFLKEWQTFFFFFFFFFLQSREKREADVCCVMYRWERTPRPVTFNCYLVDSIIGNPNAAQQQTGGRRRTGGGGRVQWCKKIRPDGRPQTHTHILCRSHLNYSRLFDSIHNRRLRAYTLVFNIQIMCFSRLSCTPFTGTRRSIVVHRSPHAVGCRT